MTYRIKIVTFKDGRKHYFAQLRFFGFWWGGIDHSGDACWWVSEFSPDSSREESLSLIDMHYEENASGKHARQSIEFEYITKT